MQDRPPHSLHAYFLLAGDPKVPIIYDVERIRDGKSFTTRRVKAIQHGQPIFIMSVSFHATRTASTHQAKMPDVPIARRAAERSRDQGARAADDAGAGAALLRARAADRAAAGRIRPLPRQEDRGRPLQRLDPRHRPAAGRSGDPSLRAGLRLRHDAARYRAAAASAAACSRRPSWRRASTMRCGCTARSAPTSGCSTPRTARTCRAPAASSRGLIFAARRHAGGVGRPGGTGARAAGGPSLSRPCPLADQCPTCLSN